jgi:hypothetical protein
MSTPRAGRVLLVKFVPTTSHTEENFRIHSASFGSAFDGQTSSFQHFAALLFAL